MGEARRRKLAGYTKPTLQAKEEPKTKPKMAVVGLGGMSTLAMVMSLMNEYPKLPK